MSKKHHYVPRGVLKNFAAGRKHNQVFVFDKARQVAYPSSVADAGSENYFNTLTYAGRTISFEPAFQNCDDRLAQLAARLVRKRSLTVLTQQDRLDLAYLAAVQLLRVKIVRERYLEFPRLLERLFAERGWKTSEQAAGSLGSIDDNDARKMSLEQLQEAPEFAKHLLEKDWSLLLAPKDHPFWTSDNPIVMDNVFPYGDLGLLSKGIEIAWPLGSGVLLAFRCPTIANVIEHHSPSYAGLLRSDPVALCTPDHVNYYNSLQVLRSLKFLYASTKDFVVARRILRDQPDLAAEKPVLMEIGKLGEPPKGRMAMGKWLVVFGTKAHYMCQLDDYSATASGFSATVSSTYKPHFFAALLADVPHAQAFLYDDQVAMQMMRGISIARDAENPFVLHVEHSDPGIRSILQRREEDKAGPPSESSDAGE